ncbi:MAG TPA: hypothetical protein VGV39_06290 [Mesorhizobium sp.]|jgi:4-amino-4-deoxy-L-arabinose transferase-like glycosyltransferase|uniref:hypothetical protein n=1 Tax=Mesorhizobium sp. TaxID=1871066 RepID=UPI002DDD2EED|nr:hypothetical protein [Mesorhizobium sp.]HEV2502664.1 hypothetical protein [Mesorhizobium sp.]
MRTIQQRAPHGRAALIFNLVLMLFPPIHLYFASGRIDMALLFFLGSGAMLVLTMLHLQSKMQASEE